MTIWFLFFVGITLMSFTAGFVFPLFWVVTFLGLAEIAFSFYKIREDQRWVPVILGIILKSRGVTLSEQEKADPSLRPYPGLFGTGIAFFPFPFFNFHIYPTKIQQFMFDVGWIATKRGRGSDNTDYGPAELRIGVALSFQWDLSNLGNAVANAPSPLGPDGNINPAIVEFLKPLMDDATKSVIASHPWADTYYDKNSISTEIERRLMNPDPSGQTAFQKAGITNPANMQVSLTSVDLPDALKAAINSEQTAIFQARATEVTAQAERYRRSQEGQGYAEAHQALFDRILSGSADEQDRKQAVEALRTLSEAAQAGKATFLLPTAILDQIGALTGGKASNLEATLRRLIETLEKKTSTT